jgi:hypothetical protein
MRSRCTSFWCVALVWLTAPAPAAASFIPWKYSWDNQPSVIYTESPGKGTVTLTNESLTNGADTSNIVATNLTVLSGASPDHPERVKNQSYSLTLFLLDEQSGKSTSLTFTGILDGTISSRTANLSNTFTGLIEQQVVLGQNVYTVRLTTYVAPPPPKAVNQGAIGVQVEAIRKVPEPSSLVLVGVGATLSFGAWWRRRLLRGRGGSDCEM